MNLFEIDDAIRSLVDDETGEVTDFEALNALQMTREQKVENLLLYIKNLNSDSKALEDEINAFKERKQVVDNKIERLKQYALYALGGEKYSSAKVSASFRNTSSVSIGNEEEFIKWAKENDTSLLNFAEPKPSKTAIKEALNRNAEVPYCSISNNTSLVIK